MTQKKLSKSDYILGLQCPLALWLKHNPSKAKNKPTQTKRNELFERGKVVNNFARKYFNDDSLPQTENNKNITFEVNAETPDLQSRIDVLQKNDDSYDLIEIKSSTSVKNISIEDLSFQKHVFKEAGYNINKCYLLLINTSYTRNGEIDPKNLFTLEDVSERVEKKHDTTEKTIETLIKVLHQKNPPKCTIGTQCSKPFECENKNTCWSEVPEYSVFNVISGKSKIGADEIYQQYGADIAEIPREKLSKSKQIEIDCYLDKNENYRDEEGINQFLEQLKYPLYFFDYEAFSSAIPPFDNTRPFQQIPFQFSLHKQETKDSKIDHFDFLHTERSDPREEITKALIENCDNVGSIVVYHQTFEKQINKDLMSLFPEYQNEIERINERIIDLIVPFRKKMIYNYKQNGSFSIKKTLPAFIPSMTYDKMEIPDGLEASNRYANYQSNGLTEESKKDLFKHLRQYCEQDTLAMVKLLQVLMNK